MKEERYHKIEAYLSRSMSPEILAQFEAELEQDPILQKEVELYNRLNHHIGNKSMDDEALNSQYAKEIRTFLRSEEAKDLDRRLREGQERYEKERTPRLKKYRWVVAIAAAIIFFGTWALFSIEKNTPETLFDSYYTNKDLPSFVKRNNVEDLTYPIVDYFKKEKHNEVLAAFAVYKETVTVVDTSLYLYIGMSYLALGENENAVASFDLMTNSNLLDNSKGLWFKALAYLKMNDRENAKRTLVEILKNSSNFKYEEAKELMALL